MIFSFQHMTFMIEAYFRNYYQENGKWIIIEQSTLLKLRPNFSVCLNIVMILVFFIVLLSCVISCGGGTTVVCK